MKVCLRCGEKKPLNDFYAQKSMADGHLGKCKFCCKKYAKEKRITDPLVRKRDNERSKTPIRKAHIKKNTIQWRLNNPDGYGAHIILNNAVRDKKVTKMPCEICGQKAHAHHDDYAKPLEVRWLCALHHHRHHAKLKENEND